jgi:hypothetical protein
MDKCSHHVCYRVFFSIVLRLLISMQSVSIVYLYIIPKTTGAGTAYLSGAPEFRSPMLSGVRVTRFLVLCEGFVNGCLSFFFWPLCCLSFFDLRIPITPLLFSNSSEINTIIFHICIYVRVA